MYLCPEIDIKWNTSVVLLWLCVSCLSHISCGSSSLSPFFVVVQELSCVLCEGGHEAIYLHVDSAYYLNKQLLKFYGITL